MSGVRRPARPARPTPNWYLRKCVECAHRTPLFPCPRLYTARKCAPPAPPPPRPVQFTRPSAPLSRRRRFASRSQACSATLCGRPTTWSSGLRGQPAGTRPSSPVVSARPPVELFPVVVNMFVTRRPSRAAERAAEGRIHCSPLSGACRLGRIRLALAAEPDEADLPRANLVSTEVAVDPHRSPGLRQVHVAAWGNVL